MAISIAWNNTSPADTDDPRNGASDIRTLKLGLNERLEAANIFIEDPSGTDANAGKQCAGISATNKWTIFETDKVTNMIEADDSNTTVVVGDGVGGSLPYEVITDKVTAQRTDFSKQHGSEYVFQTGTLAPGVSGTFPTAGNEVEITLSDEAAPAVFVAGAITFSSGGVGLYDLSKAEIEYELNSSGTWVAPARLSLTRSAILFELSTKGAAAGDGTSLAINGILDAANTGLAAGDVVKLRWSLTGDAANAGAVAIDLTTLTLFEITQ